MISSFASKDVQAPSFAVSYTHLQGILTIVHLGARLSVFDHDLLRLSCVGVGVLVVEAYARLHFVDILPTSSTRAEGIPREQARVHLDLYRVCLLYTSRCV